MNQLYLWLFLRVVPKVFSPVMCLDNLNIRKILRMRKIWAAFAIYSREYWDDNCWRSRDKKNGRIPQRSMIFRNESIKTIWKCKIKFVNWFLCEHYFRWWNNKTDEEFKSEPANKYCFCRPEEIIFFLNSRLRYFLTNI